MGNACSGDLDPVDNQQQPARDNHTLVSSLQSAEVHNIQAVMDIMQKEGITSLRLLRMLHEEEKTDLFESVKAGIPDLTIGDRHKFRNLLHLPCPDIVIEVHTVICKDALLSRSDLGPNLSVCVEWEGTRDVHLMHTMPLRKAPVMCFPVKPLMPTDRVDVPVTVRRLNPKCVSMHQFSKLWSRIVQIVS
eukprot:SAG31_NODE_1881_length_7000_cov_9.045646_1_plen_190_part_00